MLQQIIKILNQYGHVYAQGLWGTIWLSLVTVSIATVFGTLVALIKMSRIRLFQWIVNIYVEVIRGTPILLQLYFFWIFLPKALPIELSDTQCIVVALIVNAGAYVAEVIRSGIQAVDRGQTEAARALGFTNAQTMFDVVLPQAVKNAFPAIGNEFIVNIKDSSVLMIISITELMFQSSSIAGTTYRFTETYFVTACVYLLLTTVTSVILHIVENRMSHTNTSIPQSDTDPANMKLARGK